MTKVIICDRCKAESSTGGFYAVHYDHPDNSTMVTGDFCSDCMPEEILKLMRGR